MDSFLKIHQGSHEFAWDDKGNVTVISAAHIAHHIARIAKNTGLCPCLHIALDNFGKAWLIPLNVVDLLFKLLSGEHATVEDDTFACLCHSYQITDNWKVLFH